MQELRVTQEIRHNYLARTVGDHELVAATLFAEDLMRSDPETLKAGYTLDNAAIAAAEVFDVSAADVAARVLDRQ